MNVCLGETIGRRLLDLHAIGHSVSIKRGWLTPFIESIYKNEVVLRSAVTDANQNGDENTTFRVTYLNIQICNLNTMNGLTFEIFYYGST